MVNKQCICYSGFALVEHVDVDDFYVTILNQFLGRRCRAHRPNGNKHFYSKYLKGAYLRGQRHDNAL